MFVWGGQVDFNLVKFVIIFSNSISTRISFTTKDPHAYSLTIFVKELLSWNTAHDDKNSAVISLIF